MAKSSKHKKRAKGGRYASSQPRDLDHCDTVDLPPDHWNYDPYVADDLDEICRRAMERPNT